MEKASELNITVQPYIIVIGPILFDIRTSYVCIDSILYSTDSILQALDMCFKVFHVLHLQYPVFTDYLRLILQRGLYDITTKWDTMFSTTEHIIKKLQLTFNTSTK